MQKLIMSDKYGCFCRELANMGFDVIPSDTISVFYEPEQKHADMQCLRITDRYFLLNECKFLRNTLAHLNLTVISQKAKIKYPQNILLNCLFLNNVLYGKLSAVSDEVKKYCNDNNIKTVNVNQGYTRCSTLVIDEKAVITSDSSISNALKSNGAEVLDICEGHIALDGFNYGFIGGAGVKIDNTICFFGNVKLHPDFDKIESFIKKHNKKLKLICGAYPLTDIGGIVMAE